MSWRKALVVGTGSSQTPRERVARDLFLKVERALSEAGTGGRAQISGRGHSWSVTGELNSRSCLIMCSFHDRVHRRSSPVRGDARLVRIAPPPRPKQGAEYFARFDDADRICAAGHTQDSQAIIDALCAWVSDAAPIETLHEKFSFVDRNRRALVSACDAINRALAELASQARCEVDGPPLEGDSSEVWSIAGDRSLAVAAPEAGGLACVLLLSRVPLLRGQGLDARAVAQAAERWIDGKLAPAEVSAVVSGLVPEPFADLFSRGDYALWHWSNVLAEAQSDGFLSRYQPLLTLIAQNEVTSRFFSFRSLKGLCFSRSCLSMFDWAGMPIVRPAPRRGWTWPWQRQPPEYSLVVDEHTIRVGDAASTCATLEKLLRAEPVVPYLGSLEDRLAGLLNVELEGQKSPLRARGLQRRWWKAISVEGDHGARCHVFGTAKRVSVRVIDGEGRPVPNQAFVGDISGAAKAIAASLGPKLASV